MLTHELKTPLSVFKAVISSKNPSEKSITAMNDSVDEIDEIIQSCEWSAEIDREEKNNNFEIKVLTLFYKESMFHDSSLLSFKIPKSPTE